MLKLVKVFFLSNNRMKYISSYVVLIKYYVFVGFAVSLLPYSVERRYNCSIIKFMRFLGGVCFVVSLSMDCCCLPWWLFYSIKVLSILHSIQTVLMAFMKMTYGLYIISNGVHNLTSLHNKIVVYLAILTRVLILFFLELVGFFFLDIVSYVYEIIFCMTEIVSIFNKRKE